MNEENEFLRELDLHHGYRHQPHLRQNSRIMKRFTFVLAASIFLIACYLLYTSLDAANARKRDIYEHEKVGFIFMLDYLHFVLVFI